jgi:hypothetical protein
VIGCELRGGAAFDGDGADAGEEVEEAEADAGRAAEEEERAAAADAKCCGWSRLKSACFCCCSRFSSSVRCGDGGTLRWTLSMDGAAAGEVVAASSAGATVAAI